MTRSIVITGALMKASDTGSLWRASVQPMLRERGYNE
jgi:hypothetical protein